MQVDDDDQDERRGWLMEPLLDDDNEAKRSGNQSSCDNVDDDNNNNNSHNHADTRRVRTEQTHCKDRRNSSSCLPEPLQILFALNGATLALPATALLYVVNTRVQIPLNLLPSYAALAFVPFSLKPVYAHLSSTSPPSSADESSSVRKVGLPPRHVQVSILLTLSGLACIATSFIPIHGIAICFGMGFVRGVCSAWPEFLLGLTLIDQAATTNEIHHQQHQQYQTTSTMTTMTNVCALFQAQAATARNLGALLAHLVVLLCFGILERWPSHHANGASTSSSTTTKGTELLSDTSVTFLLVCTGLLNGVGALVAYIYQVGMHSAVDERDNCIVDGRSSRVGERESSSPCIQIPPPTCHETICHDEDPLLLLLLDHSESPPSNKVEESACDDLHRFPLRADGIDSSQPRPKSTSVWLIVVVLLQCSIILLTMRQPMSHVISSFGWDILTVAAVTALVGTAAFVPKTSTRENRVGIVLLLRHCAPSVTYILSSYCYTIFGTNHPGFLQFLSLLDMLVTTVASWSYGKLFGTHRDIHHGSLLCLMAGTTVFASIVSLGNVGLIHVLQPACHLGLGWKIAITVAVKLATGLADEWMFLPDVVLATVVSVDSASEHKNMQYGAFLSCIDFGDQLGALLVGPLIVAFGTSRENDWQHLDWLQGLNSIALMASVVLLLLLR
jgi:hypothetical protein